MRKTERGITLIDVLALIVIVAVLGVILAPTLATSRAYCTDNLRNVGKALLLYITANSGYFPPAFKGKWDPDCQSWRHWDRENNAWAFGHARSAHQALAAFVEAPHWPEAWDENYSSMTLTQEELNTQVGGSGHLKLTAKEYGILNCPMDIDRDFPAFSYGVNCYMCYNDFDTVETYTLDAYGKGRAVCYQKIDDIADPIRAVYMADAYYPPKWTKEGGAVPETGGKLVYLRAGAHITPGFIPPGGPDEQLGNKSVKEEAKWYMDLYGEVNKEMRPSADYSGGRLDFRHKDYTCNVLFLDGHVRAFHMCDERLIGCAGYHEVDVRRGEPRTIAIRGLLTGLDTAETSVWNGRERGWQDVDSRYRNAYDPYGRKDARGRDLTIDRAIRWGKSFWGPVPEYEY